MEQQALQDKYTAQQVADAIRKANGIYAAAARLLRCDRRTVAAYVERYATVRQAAEEANATLLDIAEGHLVTDVQKGKFEQIKYYLNAKGKARGYGITRNEQVDNPIDWELVPDKVLDDYCDGKMTEDDVRRIIVRQSRTRQS